MGSRRWSPLPQPREKTISNGWIPLLAYIVARTGGEFDKKALKILNEAAGKWAEGESDIETLAKDMKYYPYYLEAYSAALGGLVGTPIIAVESGTVEALGWNQHGDGRRCDRLHGTYRLQYHGECE